jgi:hypothetical protein
VFHNHFQMELLNTRAETYSGGQVVISATVGWGGGGKGQYRPGQCVSSSFPNAACTNKSGHIQGG